MLIHVCSKVSSDIDAIFLTSKPIYLKKFYKAFDFTLRNFYEFVNEKACDI